MFRQPKYTTLVLDSERLRKPIQLPNLPEDAELNGYIEQDDSPSLFYFKSAASVTVTTTGAGGAAVNVPIPAGNWFSILELAKLVARGAGNTAIASPNALTVVGGIKYLKWTSGAIGGGQSITITGPANVLGILFAEIPTAGVSLGPSQLLIKPCCQNLFYTITFNKLPIIIGEYLNHGYTYEREIWDVEGTSEGSKTLTTSYHFFNSRNNLESLTSSYETYIVTQIGDDDLVWSRVVVNSSLNIAFTIDREQKFVLPYPAKDVTS